MELNDDYKSVIDLKADKNSDANSSDDEPKEKKSKVEETASDSDKSYAPETEPTFIENVGVRRSPRIKKLMEAKKKQKVNTDKKIGMFSMPIPADLVMGQIKEKQKDLWVIDTRVDRSAKLIVQMPYFYGGYDGIRSYYFQQKELKVGDIIACRISTIRDNKLSLLLCGQWCGKISNAMILYVHPDRIAYVKTEIIEMSCGIKIVLTLNGYIWIGPEDLNLIRFKGYKNSSKLLNADMMKNLKTLQAAFIALAQSDILIYQESIELAFAESAKYTIPELDSDEVLDTIGIEVHNQLIMNQLLKDN